MLPIQKEHPGKKDEKKDAVKCLREKVTAVEMTLRELLEEMADLGTYNCQMLDFFFSARVGFSLEALKKRTRRL